MLYKKVYVRRLNITVRRLNITLEGLISRVFSTERGLIFEAVLEVELIINGVWSANSSVIRVKD